MKILPSTKHNTKFLLEETEWAIIIDKDGNTEIIMPDPERFENLNIVVLKNAIRELDKVKAAFTEAMKK